MAEFDFIEYLRREKGLTEYQISRSLWTRLYRRTSRRHRQLRSVRNVERYIPM